MTTRSDFLRVSGAAALVLSKCALDTTELRNAILSNVDPIPSMAGITVTGRGGPPLVQLVDRAGKVALDARAQKLDARAFVQQDTANGLTQILWKAPPKGDYEGIPLSPAGRALAGGTRGKR